MKSTTSFILLGVTALALSTAVFLIGADTLPRPTDLTIHEWGTFTSVAGEDGSAIDWDVLSGSDYLPGFVHSQQYQCLKSRLTATVRMETPVLYFYSPHELTANVKVQFPHGVITEWYPRADTANYESGGLMNQTGAIGWNDIKVQPGSTTNFPIENHPSRYYSARGTDAAPITVGDQHEKFLFYRGAARVAIPLSARLLSDGRLIVENLGAEVVPNVILFENRDGRLGYRSAAAIESSVTLDAPSLNGSLTELRRDLENTLTAQGLFPKEAHAMVETWRDSWFEEGSRLIYIVPSHAIDTMLPLQVAPAPSQTMRVFVGRIELVTAVTKHTVEDAFARKDWPLVQRYGRFLEPILDRISSESALAARQVQQFRQDLPAILSGACR